MHSIFAAPGTAAVPIHCVTAATWPAVRTGLDAAARTFADAAGFAPRSGSHLLLPAPDGSLSAVLFGLDAEDKPSHDPFTAGRLPGLIPNGSYRLVDAPGDARLPAPPFPPRPHPFPPSPNGDAK